VDYRVRRFLKDSISIRDKGEIYKRGVGNKVTKRVKRVNIKGEEEEGSILYN
jgi:hypothetical protein